MQTDNFCLQIHMQATTHDAEPTKAAVDFLLSSCGDSNASFQASEQFYPKLENTRVVSETLRLFRWFNRITDQMVSNRALQILKKLWGR